jgi:hypothetical protein
MENELESKVANGSLVNPEVRHESKPDVTEPPAEAVDTDYSVSTREQQLKVPYIEKQNGNAFAKQ